MRRYWIILALLFVAATTEENRLYRVAEAAFNDRLYDVAERQFAEFLDRFPKSDRAARQFPVLAGGSIGSQRQIS